MDFGVFLPITNNGWLFSETAPQYMPTFALNSDICRRAEEADFDFALSMVKFRGWGGKTEMWDYALDSFSLMAGLAATTSRLKLFASVSGLTMHPAMTARMCATIADISGGRFGVNIVSGWNKAEYSQMGLWPGDEFFARRYDYATEYVQVMKGLWQHGRLTHAGTYFDLDDCLCQPTPSYDIPIICAGQSQRGMRFAAEYGDYNFVVGRLEQLAELRGQLAQAEAASGRKVGAYGVYGVVTAPTDREALDKAEHLLEGTDYVALANIRQAAAADKDGTHVAHIMDATRGHLQTRTVHVEFPDSRMPAVVRGDCFVNDNLIGSYDRVANYIRELETTAGMNGLVLTFPDFREGVTEFGEHVIPRVRSRRASR